MNLALLCLSLSMAATIIVSNYLVQFPVNYLNLNQILTYGAFTYPITFLITDFTNLIFGKTAAHKIVLVGVITGLFLSLFISTNFEDIISIRISIASISAFCLAQLLDIEIFHKIRIGKYKWYVAPSVSSFFASILDTLLFFFIAFYATEMNWLSLAIGDFMIKFIMIFFLLLPFRFFYLKNLK